MWEVISAIAGVVSAACAVVSIRGLTVTQKAKSIEDESGPVMPPRVLFSFLLACSGWCLAVLSFVWIFEPYGPYMREGEYLRIAGIIVALPAVILFTSGMRYLNGSDQLSRQSKSGHEREHDDRRNDG